MTAFTAALYSIRIKEAGNCILLSSVIFWDDRVLTTGYGGIY